MLPYLAILRQFYKDRYSKIDIDIDILPIHSRYSK